MKKLPKKIIKSLLVSAAFSLLGSQMQAKEASDTNPLASDDGKSDEKINILKTRVFHDVLKMNASGVLYKVDSHRSHRSHSSHRSSSNGHSSHYSSSYTSSRSSSQGGSTTAVSNETMQAAHNTPSLGDRTLSVGNIGDDVSELVKLLEKAGCPPNPKLLEDNGRKFTADVEMAVRVFQAFAGLPVTGVVDNATIGKLKSVVK